MPAGVKLETGAEGAGMTSGLTALRRNHSFVSGSRCVCQSTRARSCLPQSQKTGRGMSTAPLLPKDSQTGLRDGEQYLRQLRDDGRQVIYDGEVVKDVSSHPAFRGAARSIA